MKNIFIAGVAVLDLIYRLDHFPTGPGKTRAQTSHTTGGGNGANAAVTLARLGARTTLAARVGDDEIADLILAGLTRENVNCDLVRKHRGHRSSFSSIYVDATGERQIVNFRDESLTMETDWFQSNLPATTDAALGDCRWPQGAAMAMQFARDKNVPGIMDAETYANEAIDAIQLASHVAFSANGVRKFSGENNLQSAALKSAMIIEGEVIVTNGANDVLEVKNSVVRRHPTFQISAVDTLAAGDIWHGAFTLALAEHMPTKNAIRFANAAAAIKCQQTGGRDGAPNRKEVEDFLNSNS